MHVITFSLIIFLMAHRGFNHTKGIPLQFYFYTISQNLQFQNITSDALVHIKGNKKQIAMDIK